MFGKEIYSARRKALLEKMKGQSGIAVFLGNTDSPAQYRDNCYKWRQDSNFLYFFGIDEPRFAAIIDLDSARETIYADDFSLDEIIWMGPQPGVSSIAASAGVENSAPYGEFDIAVLEAVARGRDIHFLPASREYNAQKLSSLLGMEPREMFSDGKKGCSQASVALVKAAIALRLVKGKEEIEELDASGQMGYQMHTIARKGIIPGRIEQEIVGDMEGFALSKGWGVSFPTILTQHGEIFHCHSHELPVREGSLMVVDAGFESNCHYASDHTRTYPTSGRFTSRQKDIYQIVCDCNNFAFSRIKPGEAYLNVHQDTCRLMLERLSQLGLVRGNVDDMLSEGVAGLFMPHGLGHNMGLDVHDMEDLGENLVGYDPDQSRSPMLGLGSLRMARRLQPGNVITDEPGIYFIPELIESWKNDGKNRDFVNYAKLQEYYNFGGIRLEDDVLVTPDGARRLGTERLPIEADEVEAAMQNDR